MHLQTLSCEEITRWKDLFRQLAQSYNEAAQDDPNNEKQHAWRAAAENMDYAAQTLDAINGMDTSGFAACGSSSPHHHTRPLPAATRSQLLPVGAWAQRVRALVDGAPCLLPSSFQRLIFVYIFRLSQPMNKWACDG